MYNNKNLSCLNIFGYRQLIKIKLLKSYSLSMNYHVCFMLHRWVLNLLRVIFFVQLGVELSRALVLFRWVWNCHVRWFCSVGCGIALCILFCSGGCWIITCNFYFVQVGGSSGGPSCGSRCQQWQQQQQQQQEQHQPPCRRWRLCARSPGPLWWRRNLNNKHGQKGPAAPAGSAGAVIAFLPIWQQPIQEVYEIHHRVAISFTSNNLILFSCQHFPCYICNTCFFT